MAEKCDPATDHDHPASPCPVSFFKVMAAPWLILSPSQAAGNMTGGSRWAFLVSFGLGTFLLAAVIVGLGMWDATVARTWVVDGRLEIRTHSMVEVWNNWHARGLIGPAELIAVAVFVVLPVMTAVAVWLFLPNVHRGGNVWCSCKGAYCAVSSGIGLLIIVTLSVGIPLVLASNAEDRATADFSFLPGMPARLSAVVAFLLCACLLVYWLGRATRSVAGPAVAVELPPRCEGCGYDLTHQPEEGLCPECGLSLDTSLAPGLRRPGCSWQQGQDVSAWIGTSLAVIVLPTGFYGRLFLRRPDAESRQYALWHYPVIGGFAAAWIAAALVIAEDEIVLMLIPPILVGLLAALAGWCVHRLVGAVMTSWAIVRGALPDVCWAARVMAYETAFLWVFCLYNGLLLSSFMVFGNWISGHVFTVMFGNQFGFPAEPVVLLLGNAALIGAWMWRYVVAFRHVRWSNC